MHYYNHKKKKKTKIKKNVISLLFTVRAVDGVAGVLHEDDGVSVSGVDEVAVLGANELPELLLLELDLGPGQGLSTFRISEIVLAQKSASASASADEMVPELESEVQIQQYIQTDSRSLSLSVQIWRDRIEIFGIRVGLIDGSGIVEMTEGW
jgi:hypothetical protein